MAMIDELENPAHMSAGLPLDIVAQLVNEAEGGG